MLEIMSVIFVVGILAGEFQIISLTTKDKEYSKIKTIIIYIYQFIGINIPVLAYALYVIKKNKEIPIITNLILLYLVGLFLIGLTTVIADYYKTYKKRKTKNI